METSLLNRKKKSLRLIRLGVLQVGSELPRLARLGAIVAALLNPWQCSLSLTHILILRQELKQPVLCPDSESLRFFQANLKKRL